MALEWFAMFGLEIRVGDWLLYPQRFSNSAVLHVGKVDALVPVKNCGRDYAGVVLRGCKAYGDRVENNAKQSKIYNLEYVVVVPDSVVTKEFADAVAKVAKKL